MMHIPRSFTRAQLNDIPTVIHQNSFRLPSYGGHANVNKGPIVAKPEGQPSPTTWQQFTTWLRGLNWTR